MSEPTDEKLTPEQIEHWRKVLFVIVGPYALMMTEADIQQFRDRMQNGISKMAAAPPEA